MKVICAWCEQEGKHFLISEVELYDRQMTSHGICGDHEKVVLEQIQRLRNSENFRVQRRRQSHAKLKSSTLVPASRTAGIRMLRRGCLLKNRPFSAQLQFPFADL